MIAPASAVTVGEDILVCALHPIRADGCVDGSLYITPVEIDSQPRRYIVSGIDLAKNRIWMRTHVSDVINVEAWIDLISSVYDVLMNLSAVAMEMGKIPTVNIWQRVSLSLGGGSTGKSSAAGGKVK